jgi:hypothetical protein
VAGDVEYPGTVEDLPMLAEDRLVAKVQATLRSSGSARVEETRVVVEEAR